MVSMALGVAFGLACSLGLKHSHLSTYPAIESCIIALVAYTSYFFSNGVTMSGEQFGRVELISGIVSLLFCGITLKHYAYHIMSTRTQRTTKYMFAVLAQLSENFIFIYLGLSLFTQDVQVFKPLFILVSAVSFRLGWADGRSLSWRRATPQCFPFPSLSIGSTTPADNGTRNCRTRIR